MENFNLRKYLAENKLLKENISFSYQVELLVPKVFFDIKSGEAADSPYKFGYTEDEIRNNETIDGESIDITYYTDGDELDEFILDRDYRQAKEFAERYPNLIRIN
jgi:hypothetical protein